MQAARTAIIIINYKTSNLMPALLASIEEPRVPIDVIILDNASTPETYAPLQQLRHEGLHLLRSEKNLGFTGGINFVLRYIDQHLPDTRYFFLLNPDALLTSNLVWHLQQVLHAHPKAASVSPRIVNLAGEEWYGGAKIDFKKGIVSTTLNGAAPAVQQQEVDVFSGCAALFDRTKAKQAGLFNEGLFMYYDEADFALKLRKLGHTILYAPGLLVHHDASYTTRNISFLKSYYMTRNKFMVFRHTMTPVAKAWYLTHELAFYLKKRRFKAALYHLKGYLHYRMGKTGQLQ